MKQLTLRVKLLDNNVTEAWFPDRGTREMFYVQSQEMIVQCSDFCLIGLKPVRQFLPDPLQARVTYLPDASEQYI